MSTELRSAGCKRVAVSDREHWVVTAIRWLPLALTASYFTSTGRGEFAFQLEASVAEKIMEENPEWTLIRTICACIVFNISIQYSLALLSWAFLLDLLSFSTLPVHFVFILHRFARWHGGIGMAWCAIRARLSLAAG